MAARVSKPAASAHSINSTTPTIFRPVWSWIYVPPAPPDLAQNALDRIVGAHRGVFYAQLKDGFLSNLYFGQIDVCNRRFFGLWRGDSSHKREWAIAFQSHLFPNIATLPL
jgi:hypothetical protein